MDLAFHIFLHLCEYSWTFAPHTSPMILFNFTNLRRSSASFGHLQCSQGLNILHTWPPSPNIVSHVHASSINALPNIWHKLPMCYNTFEEPSQACIPISYRISEASGALSHISEYSILFTHTMQTAYRIFKDLRTFLLLLPQHSKHDWYASPKISIVQEHTQARTPAFIHSHHSGLFVHTFWSLALPSDQLLRRPVHAERGKRATHELNRCMNHT